MSLVTAKGSIALEPDAVSLIVAAGSVELGPDGAAGRGFGRLARLGMELELAPCLIVLDANEAAFDELSATGVGLLL